MVGDYDHFQEVYAVKKSQLEAAYRRQQQEISELKDFVARNKARVSTRNMAMSRQKKLDKMDVIELAAEKPKPEFHFRYGRTPGRMLFETHDLVTGYDEPLSKPLNLSMERGQKIAITGTNGIGKTTLLKSILGLIPSLSGSCELGENLQIGYFEQEVRGDNRTTCIEELWQDFPSYTQYEIRSALAKCGLTTKHIESQVRVLSGGEQAKVRLCKLSTGTPTYCSWTSPQPPRRGCQGCPQERPQGIQGQHPADLPRAGILSGRGKRSLGYEPLDHEDFLKRRSPL